jgi:hypothetical protein
VLAIAVVSAPAGCTAIVGAGDYVIVDGGVSPSDDASADTGTGDETGPTADADAASCTRVTTMPLPSQGGAGCQQGDGSTCWPHDTTNFTHTWVQPVGAHLGVCTAGQISDYFNACQASSSTTQACNLWTSNAANAACYHCVYTSSDSTAYGAIVDYPNVNLDQVNVAGCIALVEPCNQPCAAAMLAQLQCENAACTSPFCGDFDSYQACSNEADTCTDCQNYVEVASNCQAGLMAAASQHPSVGACNLNASDFQGYFTAIATVMCGP